MEIEGGRFKREQSAPSRPAGIYNSVSQTASHGGGGEAGRVIGRTCVLADGRVRVLTLERIDSAAVPADGTALCLIVDEELELELEKRGVEGLKGWQALARRDYDYVYVYGVCMVVGSRVSLQRVAVLCAVVVKWPSTRYIYLNHILTAPYLHPPPHPFHTHSKQHHHFLPGMPG